MHSAVRKFSQNMDANADLNTRVGMEFDTLEDAWEFWVNMEGKWALMLENIT